jgi:thiamine monophosphate kinase
MKPYKKLFNEELSPEEELLANKASGYGEPALTPIEQNVANALQELIKAYGEPRAVDSICDILSYHVEVSADFCDALGNELLEMAKDTSDTRIS